MPHLALLRQASSLLETSHIPTGRADADRGRDLVLTGQPPSADVISLSGSSCDVIGRNRRLFIATSPAACVSPRQTTCFEQPMSNC